MHQERQWYPVGLLCRVFGVWPSGYYAWLTTESKRARSDALLLADIKRIHLEHKSRYGSPRIYRQLRTEGKTCSKPRVERLMRDNGILARHKRKYKATTDSNHTHPVAPNILAGRFEWEQPNQAWVGDISYISTVDGWLYLAVLLDLCSRSVVGWAVDSRMTRHLPLRALHMAVQRRRPPPGLLHHTDRGSQYASADYQRALRSYGMVCSMSATGRCFDNAVAESFFHSLKIEAIHGERFDSREMAISAIFRYMEGYYNNKRLHSALDYVTPNEYERRMQLKAA